MGHGDIVIYGTGGTALDVLETLKAINQDSRRWNILGFIDDNSELKGNFLAGYEILGTGKVLTTNPMLKKTKIVIGVGNCKDLLVRKKIRDRLGFSDDRFPTIIHPQAAVSSTSHIGQGTVFMCGSSCASATLVGSHVLVLQNTTIGHHSVIEDYATFSSGVNVGGGVRIGRGCYIGIGACLYPGVVVGPLGLIGVGSVVLRNVSGRTTVIGNPARRLRKPRNRSQYNRLRKASLTNRMQVETKVRHAVAAATRCGVGDIDLSALQVDSLASVVLHEDIKRELRVDIPQETWTSFGSLREIVDYVTSIVSCNAGSEIAERRALSPTISLSPNRFLSNSGHFSEDLDIGMPLTGANQLAEHHLLAHVGDFRWAHISALTGVPTKDIVDAGGNRLYATFFFVEIAFPESHPMSAFRENDHVKLVGTIGQYGGSMLDGICYLFPAEGGGWNFGLPVGTEDALRKSFPSVRLSNMFVRQINGPGWLKQSKPADPRFELIPQLTAPPNSYEMVKNAASVGRFESPGPDYMPLTSGPVRTEYHLVQECDLNGAGLVYFARLPLILDIAERQVLQKTRFPLDEEFLIRRTTLRRRSAFLSNASFRDTLQVEVEPWIQNPFLTPTAKPDLEPLRLFVNFRITRKSDNRPMMVSSARKLVEGNGIKELPFYRELKDFQHQ